MPAWPLKDWFKSGSAESRPSYELVHQDELPTLNELPPPAQAGKNVSQRRGLYRVLAAVLIVLLGLYLLQSQGSSAKATSPQDDVVPPYDEIDADPALAVDNGVAPPAHDVSLNKPPSEEEEYMEYPQNDSPPPVAEQTTSAPPIIYETAPAPPPASETSTAAPLSSAAAPIVQEIEPPNKPAGTSTAAPAPTDPIQETAATAPAATAPADKGTGQYASASSEDKPAEAEPAAEKPAVDKPTTDKPTSANSEAEKPAVQHDQGIWIGERKLHLLVPSTDANPHMCRTLFTAAAMGYPTPALINWGEKPKAGQEHVSHLEKVAGITNYLKALGPGAANDLALITDAYDVWFNLPAEILVARYDRIIAEENQYVSDMWGPPAIDVAGMRATTVFAADKGCFGFSYNNFECWLHPESSLPTDTYGNKTEVEDAGYFRYSTFRPRFLNSGIIMGPVSELLAVFERAEDYMTSLDINPEHDFWQSDQRVLIMVLAAQQLMRTRKALKNPQWLPTGKSIAQNRTSPFGDASLTPNLDFHPDFGKLQYKKLKFQTGEENVGYEHGMVIDYAAALSHTTNAADYEWAYVNYSPEKKADRPKLDDPRDCVMHLSENVPADIANVAVPYASVVRPPSDAASAQALSWKDLSLYTNLCTGEVPVIIHHNGDKTQRDKQWPSLWFSKSALDILAAARKRAAAQPKLNINTGGAISDHGSPLSWDQLCKASEQKMFVEDYKKFLPGATQHGVPPEFFRRRRDI